MLTPYAATSATQLSWRDIRNQFDLDPQYAHLSLMLLASHPTPVRNAIAEHRRQLDRNPTLYHKNMDRFNQRVREKAAHYLQTHPDSLALTESTTMGLAVAYTGVRLRQDQEILTTIHEHYTVSEMLRFKAMASGASLRHIRLYRQSRSATAREILDSIANAIAPNTRVLALTWVHSTTGVKLPIADIAALVAAANRTRTAENRILLCVDGVHAFGVEDFVIADLNCDFFAAGCHKWLFGPRGTGLVWGSAAGWDSVTPIMTSFDKEALQPWLHGLLPDDTAPKARLANPGGFAAYEHRWALAEAFDFHLSIGKARVANRIKELNHYCKAELAKIPRVVLRTPSESALSSGLVCFDVLGFDPSMVVERLLAEGIIAGQTPYYVSHVRVSPGIVNSFDDIDRLIAALRTLVRDR